MTVSEILRRAAGGGDRSGTTSQPAPRPTSEDLDGNDGGGSGGPASDDATSLTETLIRGASPAGGCEQQVSLKQELLIRLFRENFVSLEASACADSLGTSFRTSSSDTHSTDPVGVRQVKLCLVDDWRGARILDSINGSQLWPTSSQPPPPSSHYDDPHQGLTTLSNETGHQQQAAPFGLPADGAGRLAFASATSVISLLGIIANLLILLIIVINTKQKLPNFLSRGSPTSSTNYHFVLLFQLTLTGLLIGSCALLNTTSQLSHYQHSDGYQPVHNNNHHHYYYHHQPVTWSQLPFSVHLDEVRASDQGDPLDGMLLQDHFESQQAGRRTALLISLDRDDGHLGELAQLVATNQTTDPARATQAFKVVHVERLNSEAWPRPRRQPFDLSRVLFDLIAAIYIWTVAGLAFDRYCAIAYPLEYLRAVSSSRARNFLLVLWLSAVLLLVLMPIGVSLLEDTATVETDQSIARSILLECSRDRMEPENSNQAVDEGYGGHELGDRLAATLLAIWSGGQATWSPTDSNSGSNRALQVSLSLMIFLLAVVAPLAIATICNLSIYGIVKGHERRMSASSSSQQAAAGSTVTGGSITGAASFASSLRHNYWSLFRRDNSFCSTSTTTVQDRHHHHHHNQHRGQPHHHMRHCDTCSSASSLSILGKLVRASQQVGASLACRQVAATWARRSSSTWSSGSSGSSSSELADGSGCRADQEALQRLLEHRPACGAGCVRRRDFSSASSSQRSSFRSATDGSLVKRRARNSPAAYNHDHHHDQPKQSAGSQLELAAKRKLKRKLSDKDELEDCAACFGPNRNRLLLSQHSFDSPGQCRISGLCGPASVSPRSTWTQLLNPNSSQLGKQQIVTQTNSSSPLDSDGIMRQLKLAGLSFAGIPINELMQTSCDARRPLNRSSSCSLGNLNAWQANSFADGARYSSPWNTARTCASNTKFQTTFRHQLDKKCSFVSLDQASGKTKCHTQLQAGPHLDSLDSLALPAGGDTKQPQRTLLGYANLCSLPAAGGGGGPNSQLVPANQNRVQFNVVFNVAVWLILLLLACSIPQYCLLMMLELARPGTPVASGGGASSSSVEELLDEFLLDYANKTGNGLFRDNRPNESDPVRVGLATLTCLCDLLFLLTLPLNAWLYGIRSRSLKVTLKMMLRKYISKRQASIEIDQRRKSVMLQRSRDSSIVGLIGAHSETNHQLVCSCQREARGAYGQQRRVVRRCASFNLPSSCLPVDQHNNFEPKLPPPGELDSELETSPKLERTFSASSATETTTPTRAKPAHTNSIRFMLGDELQASPPQTAQQSPSEAAGFRHGLLDCLLASNASCQSSGSGGWRRPFKWSSASLNTTPAISSRSLLSASIQSSHSTALLLLNGTAHGDELKPPAASQAATVQANQETAVQPLAGVLKNGQRHVAMRHRQESCESAGGGSLMSGGPGDGPRGALRHCHLARVQSSPGELALASARVRSQLEPEQANKAGKCHHFNDRQRFESPAAAASQRDSNASKIKLLLTSADDETSTREPLVGGLEEERLNEAEFVVVAAAADDEDDEDDDEDEDDDDDVDSLSGMPAAAAAGTGLVRATGRSLASGMAKLEAKQRRRPDFEGARSRQSADYCRQIKEAIARYFASSRRRRRLGSSSKQQRRRRLNQARCSCDSRRHHRKSALDSQLAPFQQRAEVEPARRLATSPAGCNASGQQQQRIKPSQSTGCFQQACATGRPEIKCRPPMHLKPPSSLKLVNLERLLTGGPTPATYSSLLALSPIKECSSNHSCASSLSSLNNVFGQPHQQQPPQPHDHQQAQQ